VKQTITVRELERLTDVQKENLNNWWKPQAFDHYVNRNMEHFFIGHTVGDKFVTYGDNIPHGKEGLLPLLSIGQMIQFIQEVRSQLKGISKNRFDKWFVNIETSQLGYKDELCDALWEAVKRVL